MIEQEGEHLIVVAHGQPVPVIRVIIRENGIVFILWIDLVDRCPLRFGQCMAVDAVHCIANRRWCDSSIPAVVVVAGEVDLGVRLHGRIGHVTGIALRRCIVVEWGHIAL